MSAPSTTGAAPDPVPLSGSSPGTGAPPRFEPVATAAVDGAMNDLEVDAIRSDLDDLIADAGRLAALARRERVALGIVMRADERRAVKPGPVAEIAVRAAGRLCSRLSNRLRSGASALARRPATTPAAVAAKARAVLAIDNATDEDGWWAALRDSVIHEAAAFGAPSVDLGEIEVCRSPAPAASLDAALLALIASHAAAAALATEAEVLVNVAQARFNADAPKRPAILFWRVDDPFHSPRGRERSPSGGWYQFYTEADIEAVRKAPEPCHFSSGSHNSPEGPGMAWRPDPRRIARKAAILEAYDGWQAERSALAESVGLTAARAQHRTSADAARRIELAILEASTETLSAVVAKARWIEEHDRVGQWSEFVLYDVLNLGEAADHAEPFPERAALLAIVGRWNAAADAEDGSEPHSTEAAQACEALKAAVADLVSRPARDPAELAVKADMALAMAGSDPISYQGFVRSNADLVRSLLADASRLGTGLTEVSAPIFADRCAA